MFTVDASMETSDDAFRLQLGGHSEGDDFGHSNELACTAPAISVDDERYG